MIIMIMLRIIKLPIQICAECAELQGIDLECIGTYPNKRGFRPCYNSAYRFNDVLTNIAGMSDEIMQT